MGDINSLFSALFLTVMGTFTASPYSCEWWLDNDLATVKSEMLTGSQLGFQVETSGLPSGFHTFSCRLFTSEGEPGSIFHKGFYVPDKLNSKTRYEYWFDDDYSVKVTGEMESTAQAFEIDLPEMSPGLHSFNCRLSRNENEWGPVYRQGIYLSSDSNEVTAYEYWIDDDYAGRQKRFADGKGDMFEIDLNELHLDSRKHWFNLRVCDNKGTWGAVYRSLFSNPNLLTPTKILGYRHYVNDINLGYVELGNTIDKEFDIFATLPDKEILSESSISVFYDLPGTILQILYAIQLETDCGWTQPFTWVLNLEKMKCQDVRVVYDGRYITLLTDEENAEIRYSLAGAIKVDDATYTNPMDIRGLGRVNAKTVKPGFLDSNETSESLLYYADETHALAQEPGMLDAAFEWDEEGVKDLIETFSVESPLDDVDYQFLRNMDSLRHLSIEKGYNISIPDNAFADSKLISISLPEDIMGYGNDIFTGSTNLSSVVWNSRTQQIESSLTESMENPNVFIYVPVEGLVTEYGNLNVVTDGIANRILLQYGYPYYAARDVRARLIKMNHQFNQETEIGLSQGWETIVLPFTPERITHEAHGEAVPFAAWDGDKKGLKPFWLYKSTSDGWEMSASIEAGIPYIIAMPNNPDYVESFNLSGMVIFSASEQVISSESNSPYVTPWIEDTEFVGTFLPVEESDVLSLNVLDSEGTFLPGSTFVPYAETLPFGAYIRNASGRKQIPVFGDSSGILIPAVANDGIIVMSPAPGTMSISSTHERRVPLITSTGAIMRTLDLSPGETQIVDGLPRDLYIIAGAKVLVR